MYPDQQRIDRFIQELDTQEARGQGALPPEDQHALEIARQLGALDLSAHSQARLATRCRLAGQMRRQQPAAFGQWRIAISASAVMLLAFFLGWGFSNGFRPPIPTLAADNTAPRAAYITASTSPTAMPPSAQASIPRPIPTPIAPPIASTRTLARPPTLPPHSTTVSP